MGAHVVHTCKQEIECNFGGGFSNLLACAHHRTSRLARVSKDFTHNGFNFFFLVRSICFKNLHRWVPMAFTISAFSCKQELKCNFWGGFPNFPACARRRTSRLERVHKDFMHNGRNFTFLPGFLGAIGIHTLNLWAYEVPELPRWFSKPSSLCPLLHKQNILHTIATSSFF